MDFRRCVGSLLPVYDTVTGIAKKRLHLRSWKGINVAKHCTDPSSEICGTEADNGLDCLHARLDDGLPLFIRDNEFED